jgi:hypothetical protein
MKYGHRTTITCSMYALVSGCCRSISAIFLSLHVMCLLPGYLQPRKVITRRPNELHSRIRTIGSLLQMGCRPDTLNTVTRNNERDDESRFDAKKDYPREVVPSAEYHWANVLNKTKPGLNKRLWNVSEVWVAVPKFSLECLINSLQSVVALALSPGLVLSNNVEDTEGCEPCDAN